MSVPERRAMVEPHGAAVSVRQQCALLNLSRSGVYQVKALPAADDLALMRRIDALHLELPFYGSRRMTFALNAEGCGVNRNGYPEAWSGTPPPVTPGHRAGNVCRAAACVPARRCANGSA